MGLASYTFQEIKHFKQEVIWKNLGKVTIIEAAEMWLRELSWNTKRAYKNAFQQFFKNKILDPDMSMQAFSQINHFVILQKIQNLDRSRATIQARCATYISYTKYLADLTEGMISCASACKYGKNKVFKKIRNHAYTQSIKANEWKKLLTRVSGQDRIRERLLLTFLLHGGKRAMEVLLTNVEDVDFIKKMVRFKQLKSQVCEEYTYISFPAHVFDDIKTYLDGRQRGPLFTSKSPQSLGRRLSYDGLYTIIRNLGKEIGVFITPQMLRVSCVTFLRSKKIPDHQIQKITGHACSDMISYYDKDSLCYNHDFDLAKDYQDADCSK